MMSLCCNLCNEKTIKLNDCIVATAHNRIRVIKNEWLQLMWQNQINLLEITNDCSSSVKKTSSLNEEMGATVLVIKHSSLQRKRIFL